jgi:hypothetical protein
MTTDLAIRQPTHTYADLERMAVAIAKSGLFGVKTPEQALSLMLLAQAEGLHPAIAARDYHIIDGKPALKADAMLARFMAAGGRVEWHELSDGKVSATFSHSIGGTLRIEWTIEMAKRAELTSKDNWRKYPRAMLRSRVVSEGIRSVYPGVITGVYTPDELHDDVELRDVTPRADAGKRSACSCGSPRGPHDPDCDVYDAVTARELVADAPPAAFDRESLMQGVMIDHLAAIEAAATLTDLKKAHAIAYTAAYAVNDTQALAALAHAKDAAKARLSGVSA